MGGISAAKPAAAGCNWRQNRQRYPWYRFGFKLKLEAGASGWGGGRSVPWSAADARV